MSNWKRTMLGVALLAVVTAVAGELPVGTYNLNIDWRYARAQKPAKLVDSLKNVEKGSQRHPSRHGVQSFRIIADA